MPAMMEMLVQRSAIIRRTLASTTSSITPFPAVTAVNVHDTVTSSSSSSSSSSFPGRDAFCKVRPSSGWRWYQSPRACSASTRAARQYSISSSSSSFRLVSTSSYHQKADEKSSNKKPPPFLKDIQVDDASSTKELYDEWAQLYEKDIRSMGYDMPEQVVRLLQDHGVFVSAAVGTVGDGDSTSDGDSEYSILDAGCGDGLSGVALRNAAGESCDIVGGDVSHNMLEIAQQRGCYDCVGEMDLNQPLANYEDNSLDLVACVGTMTYVDPTGPCLDEFLRTVKSGGYVVYTNRTDKLEHFYEKETLLENEKRWKLMEKRGPLPYLPDNPEFGKDVEVMILLYQVQ